MTFSTKSVVDEIAAHWSPAWERVSPVKQATFDLGDGKSVTGTVSGEIALFFCRPDGVVFDVLPALQSPARTLTAIREARAFYERTGATSEAIAAHHQAALAEPDALSPEEALASRARTHAKLNSRRKTEDSATRDLAEMSFSKVLLIAPAEEVIVVEPGGLRIYHALIHDLLGKGEERTPLGWKQEVFVEIFEQPLEGGHSVYDTDTLEALSLTE